VATAGFVLFYNSTAPVPTTWLNWFASDGGGLHCNREIVEWLTL
jgi:hypothetical protein